jgi:hypothetical protein
MPCELWVGGYGRPGKGPEARVSPLSGSYYEFLVSVPSVIPTGPETRLPTRLNPGQTNHSYDDYYHAAGVANNTCLYPDGYWQISRQPKYFYKGDCFPIAPETPLDPSKRHDCVNGNCIPATVYKTMGFYSNLADCQAGCAKNSNCLGECVPQSEIENLRTAVFTLKSKVCK